MQNPFSHIDLRVPDLEAGVEFYSILMPAIGFSKYLGGQDFRSWTTPEGHGPSRAWFGITLDAEHRPNGNRIAFGVESRAEVDRIAPILERAGARAISGPKLMPAYTPTYYALFFDDPWGNPLEILHWTE